MTQQKQILQKPVFLKDLLQSAEARRYRPVMFNGTYDIKHQFLVDNQIYEGKLGALVLTPFILENNEGDLQLSLNSRNVPELRVSRMYSNMLDSEAYIAGNVGSGTVEEMQGSTNPLVRQFLEGNAHGPIKVY